MEAEGVWRLVGSRRSAFDPGDIFYEYELRTEFEHGMASYSSKSKRWSVHIIEVCGFCLDFDQRLEGCPYHPEQWQKPAPKPDLEYPVRPEPLPYVPEQHRGKAEREAARGQAAREPVFR